MLVYDFIDSPIHASVLTESCLFLVLFEKSGLQSLSKQPVPEVMFSETAIFPRFSLLLLIRGKFLCMYVFAD